MGSSSITPLDFSQRISPCQLPELMDGACSYEDFRDCLRSLETVNRLFLGYRPTLAWLSRLPLSPRRRLHIVDVGSGGGDLLRKIARWAARRGVAVLLTGIDLNPYAKRAAADSTPKELNIEWIAGNALLYRPEQPVDLVVTSLTMHHLEDEEIITLLRWMDSTAQAGWFINDLERSAWASYAFGWLAKAVGWHRFVRHDGPVSFRRAFRKDDWLRLLAAADIPIAAVTLESWHPGRLCVGRWRSRPTV